MVRKTLIALAAGAALGLILTPGAAFARGGHGGMHGGMHAGPSMHGGPAMGSHFATRSAAFRFRDRDRDFRFDHRRFRHRFALFAIPGGYDYDDGYACDQPRLVRTPHGWRWRHVYACY